MTRADALARYYNNRPQTGWDEDYVSAYAASPPLEDWAETRAHYLPLRDRPGDRARKGGF